MTTALTITAQLLAWHHAGQRAALATVIETWGSAPRRAGSQLAISETGAMEGSVSGGCVEGAVVMEALEVLETGVPRILTYGVSDDDAFAVGLACGGTMRMLVEPVGDTLTVGLLEQIHAAEAARQPIGTVVDLTSWARRVVTAADWPERFREDTSGLEDTGFVTIHNPPLRMAIIGAVHIAQNLAPMAKIAGFDVTVIDPRPPFATEDRFPDAAILGNWPDAALDGFGIDARSAIVMLTHDAKLDDPALQAALRSPAFYVGALGSRRTHAKRVARLEGAGFTADEIARIDAPVGLDIGAVTPAEIAVSIIGQVVAALRGKSC